MGKSHNLDKETIKFVEKALEEIQPELDIEYCQKLDYKDQNGEKDSNAIELFSRESTKIAKDSLPDLDLD